MVMAGAVCLFFGFGFVVLSPLMLLLGWGDTRKRRRWERTPKLTCAELVGRAPTRCVVIGEIRAGPAGLQSAALTGGAVAWHRTRVWRRYAVSGEEYSELLWEHTSRGPFSLHDATGSVLVSPALFDADTASSDKLSLPPTEKVRDEYHRCDRRSGRHGGLALQQLTDRGLLPRSVIERQGRKGTRAWAVDEVVLRPNQQVYVLATSTWQEGRLVLDRPRRGLYLFSSRTEQQLHAAREEDARGEYIGAKWFPVIGAVLLLVGWLLAVVLPGNAVLG